MRKLGALAFTVSLVSCQCGGLDLTQQQFACVSNADCFDERICVSGLCADPDGGSGGGAAAGGGLGGGTGGGLGGGTGGGDGGGTGGGDDDGGVGGGTGGGVGGGAGGGVGGGAGGSDAGTDAGFDAGVDAGLPLSALCSTNAQCQAGRCVDGRCCNTTCAAPCDFCNLAGSEGTCTMAPFGKTPSPLCPGGFACNGGGLSCISACNSDAGCVNSRCAIDTCIPKISELKEDFNSGGFDASVWGAVAPNCSVVNNQFQTTTRINNSTYDLITSARRFDLLNSELRIQLVNAGSQPLATLEAYASICDVAAGNRCVAILGSNNQIQIELNNSGSFSALVGPFPMTNLRNYRMREAGGTMFLEVQNDAGTYIQLGAAATPFPALLQDVRASFGAGTYNMESVTSTVVWDNINVP
jgi:hypothetical protein